MFRIYFVSFLSLSTLGLFQCAGVEPFQEELPTAQLPTAQLPKMDKPSPPEEPPRFTYSFLGSDFYKTFHTDMPVFSDEEALFKTVSSSGPLFFVDLNQDQKIDVLAGAFPGVIDFIPQTQSQTWQSPTTHLFEQDQKLSIGNIVDWNQDGKFDLLVNRQQGFWGIDTTWSIALGKGDGTFETTWHDIDKELDRFRYGGKDSQSRCFGRCLFDLSTASFDVNQDGKLDLILGYPGVDEKDWNNELGFMAILFGNGNGTFQETPMIIPIHGKPSTFAFGDIDADGYLDIVVSHSGYDNYSNPGQQIKGVSILYGQADGSFVQTRILGEEQGRFGDLFLTDLNHDKKMDIVLSSSGFHVLLNQGNRGFSSLSSWLKPVFPNAPEGYLWFIPQVELKDMDGDGNVDVVEIAYSRKSSLTYDPKVDPPGGPSYILIYNGDGKGKFSAPQFVPLGMSGGIFYITDINQDQKLDFIVGGGGLWKSGNYYTGGISLYLNQTVY